MTTTFVLESHLRARGLWNPDGVHRAARARYCKKCGAVVLVGLDDDTSAFTAIADPFPLDGPGELTALLTGRTTYRLRWAGGRYELDARDQFHIAGSPPGALDVTGRLVEVLAAHACGQVLSTAALADPRPAYVRHQEPPY